MEYPQSQQPVQGSPDNQQANYPLQQRPFYAQTGIPPLQYQQLRTVDPAAFQASQCQFQGFAPLPPRPSPQSALLQNQRASRQSSNGTPSSQGRSSISNLHTQRETSPINYQFLLLALADDCFNAARSQTASIARWGKSHETERYYRLMSTGLGCIKVVLRRWRLPPRMEAKLRLRYAEILFEETENDLEIETTLSKGINICERSKWFDLKYRMQHLLVQLMSKTNPKAGTKYLDTLISNTETYQHFTWTYIFRFLRIGLALSQNSNDAISAFNNAKAIANLSAQREHKGIFVLASIIEAIILLRSSSSDGMEQAQRAVASAHIYQLDPQLQSIPQLNGLLYVVDLLCSISTGDTVQAETKLRTMQDFLDGTSPWPADGSFEVYVGTYPGQSFLENTASRDVYGNEYLKFDWLGKKELYQLAYLLSGIAKGNRTSPDGQKAEKYFREGIKVLNDDLDSTTTPSLSQCLSTAVSKVQWKTVVSCFMYVQLAFFLCVRSDWTGAASLLGEYQKCKDRLADQLPDFLGKLGLYLQGIIYQGTGNLASALAIYQSSAFVLPNFSTPAMRTLPSEDISILAALNSVLIIRDPTHAQHSNIDGLLMHLSPLCSNHPNKSMQAAYHFVQATSHADDTIIHVKESLQHALTAARSVTNNQLLTLTLVTLSMRFFKGVVGEQAEKSARAGQALSRKVGDRLWISIADNLLADALEVQGKGEEAQLVRDEGTLVAGTLPDRLFQRA